MQKYLFKVYHEYDDYPNSNREFLKLIGVYSTIEKAKDAMRRTAELPGFSNYLDGFSISKCQLGKDGWADGFCNGLCEGGEE